MPKAQNLYRFCCQSTLNNQSHSIAHSCHQHAGHFHHVRHEEKQHNKGTDTSLLANSMMYKNKH